MCLRETKYCQIYRPKNTRGWWKCWKMQYSPPTWLSTLGEWALHRVCHSKCFVLSETCAQETRLVLQRCARTWPELGARRPARTAARHDNDRVWLGSHHQALGCGEKSECLTILLHTYILHIGFLRARLHTIGNALSPSILFLNNFAICSWRAFSILFQIGHWDFKEFKICLRPQVFQFFFGFKIMWIKIRTLQFSILSFLFAK